MAEYIDKDKLLQQIDCRVNAFYDEEMQIKDMCIQLIENAPTEDVVPRSEVEELKAKYEKQDLWAKLLKAESHAPIIDKAKQEVAREIFEEIAKIFQKHEKSYTTDICELLFEDLGTGLAELKKKYIGEKGE